MSDPGMPYQASCVAIGGRGLLIQGPPASGKSSLALALIDRGAALIGDDGVMLEQRAGRLWACPAPNTRGLLEIRNVGIVTLPCCAAPLAMAIELTRDAPRYIEQADRLMLAGASLPLVTLWPDSPVLALRAEWALRIHGLAQS